jgi:acetoacetyl-CoA synthetase
MTRFQAWLSASRGLSFADYDAMWRWSVTDLEGFWQSLWDYFEIGPATLLAAVLSSHRMPGAKWFAGTSVNYAGYLFRQARADRCAIIARNEAGVETRMSWAELEREVASLAASLRRLGVIRGDRVVAYLPNIAPTIVAFLAVASVGAIWSVCSPDMGAQSVLDRFRQIRPRILIGCDGYQYGGRDYDRRDVIAELLAELPSLEHFILVPCLKANAETGVFRDSIDFSALVAQDVPLETEALPFDHPLWVVYSSGTTGLPKPIVHGHGGILLEALKGTVLHNDLGRDDVFHWYSSTGWIMWNSQVGGLLAGATICIYDGNPTWPDTLTLWRVAAETGMTFFGAGAAV